MTRPIDLKKLFKYEKELNDWAKETQEFMKKVSKKLWPEFPDGPGGVVPPPPPKWPPG